jgi:hypothetical protein
MRNRDRRYENLMQFVFGAIIFMGLAYLVGLQAYRAVYWLAAHFLHHAK